MYENERAAISRFPPEIIVLWSISFFTVFQQRLARYPTTSGGSMPHAFAIDGVTSLSHAQSLEHVDLSRTEWTQVVLTRSKMAPLVIRTDMEQKSGQLVDARASSRQKRERCAKLLNEQSDRGPTHTSTQFNGKRLNGLLNGMETWTAADSSVAYHWPYHGRGTGIGARDASLRHQAILISRRFLYYRANETIDCAAGIPSLTTIVGPPRRAMILGIKVQFTLAAGTRTGDA
ncbi:hypothetical protein R3P38DRAFT_1212775 [Favolaschia claudopus]|uniref:Uncharacterized protein n=1 Tax=Favolaschia claudopus TaxID=2862362 RepID=A0AAW0B6N3_9AGAR